MKIGTYNIWNDKRNFEGRMDLLIELINEKKIDVLGLQEVRDEAVVKRIKEECGFKDYFWKQYFDCQEGLAILSNYSLTNRWTNWEETEDIHNSTLMCVNFEIGNQIIALINLHLDDVLSTNRETEIVKAVNYMNHQNVNYKFLIGDFNTYPDSKVYRYLTASDSLNGENAEWIDIPEAWCIRKGEKLEPTLDFINNPRWFGQDVLYKPGRFDWIFMDDPYPSKTPKLTHFELIGKELTDGITPSDHYGVVVEMEFER